MSAHLQSGLVGLKEIELPVSESSQANFLAKIIATQGNGLRLSIACKKFSDVQFCRIIHPKLMSEHEQEEAKLVVRKETAEQARLLDQIAEIKLLKQDVASISVTPVGLQSRMLISLGHDDASIVHWHEIAEDAVRIIAAVCLSELGLRMAFMQFADIGICNQAINLSRSDN